MSGAEGREEFEAWARCEYQGALSLEWCGEGDDYVDSQTAVRWEAWQASRSQALVDAAAATRCYKCEAEILALGRALKKKAR